MRKIQVIWEMAIVYATGRGVLLILSAVTRISSSARRLSRINFCTPPALTLPSMEASLTNVYMYDSISEGRLPSGRVACFMCARGFSGAMFKALRMHLRRRSFFSIIVGAPTSLASVSMWLTRLYRSEYWMYGSKRSLCLKATAKAMIMFKKVTLARRSCFSKSPSRSLTCIQILRARVVEIPASLLQTSLPAV